MPAIRNILTAAALAASSLAHAADVVVETPAGDQVDFAKVQDQCEPNGEIRYGEGQRWKDCKLTRARFVSTLGLLDFYSAQYCLIKTSGKCDQQALVIFANRAYRTEATGVFQRIDPAGTSYTDPVVTGSENTNLLTFSVTKPGISKASYEYFQWKDAAWKPVSPRAWATAVKAKLPRDFRLTGSATPAPTTLSATVSVSGPAGGTTARIDYGFREGLPFVSTLKIAATH